MSGEETLSQAKGMRLGSLSGGNTFGGGGKGEKKRLKGCINNMLRKREKLCYGKIMNG